MNQNLPPLLNRLLELEARLSPPYSSGAVAARPTAVTIREAIDEIVKLSSLNAELLAALEKIAAGEGYYGAQAAEYKQIARAAIAKAKGE